LTRLIKELAVEKGAQQEDSMWGPYCQRVRVGRVFRAQAGLDRCSWASKRVQEMEPRSALVGSISV
jgi:hypothetical protein